jgi:tRNA threonylcarbamoyladenosine biosynthesis protein TsaB
MMELSIDTASETASVALSEAGELIAEITWRCRRNHTVELLPTIDRLLEQANMEMGDVRAVFACVGPGTYTGLRVGVSTAKGLAVGLGVPALGVGRLELDAHPHLAFPGTVVAVHRAGRGELAWAAFGEGTPEELSAPRLSKPEELASRLPGPSLLIGEVDEEMLEAVRSVTRHEVRRPPAAVGVRHAAVLAEVGHSRLRAGEPSDPGLLVAVYLRPPAIGPQPPAA